MSLTEESSDVSDQASDISDSDSTKVDDCSQNENEQLEIYEPQDTLLDVFFLFLMKT